MNNQEERGSRIYIFTKTNYCEASFNPCSKYYGPVRMITCLVPIGLHLVSTEEGIYVSDMYGVVYTAMQILNLCFKQSYGFRALKEEDYEKVKTRATTEEI